MATVSELTSKNIASAQANVQTWGDILYNVKVYGAKGDGVTDDTSAILSAIAAIPTTGGTLYFPDGNYLILFNHDVSGASFYTFIDQKNIRIKGKGATIKDGNTYTVNALTNVFKFVRCENIEVDVNYEAIPLSDPDNDLGYLGSSFLYFEENCSFIKVDSVINHARYGVRSGDYSNPTKGYCANFDLRLKTNLTGYPVAFYLVEHANIDIDADGVHRALYLAGCQDIKGNVTYKNFCLANMSILLTNSITTYSEIQSEQIARGCELIDLTVIDQGSTSAQSLRACVGISLQWISQGTKYENIRINIQMTTDDDSRTLGAFVIKSNAKNIRTEAPYNWEDYISFKNIIITGSIDRTAQTLANSAWGDIFIEGYDPDDLTYVHAPTFSNIVFDNLTINKSVPMNGNIIRVPKLQDMIVLRNIFANGLNFAISSPNATTKIENSIMNVLSSHDGILTLIQVDSTISSVTASVTNNIIRDFGATSGTWTPVLEGSTTAGTNTYATQSGNYYKVGKLVHLTFLLTLSAKDVAIAGNLIITGLPFSAKDGSERAGASLSYQTNITLTTNYTSVIGDLQTNKINLYQSGSGQSTLALPASAISDTSGIWGSIMYETT